MRFTVLLFAVFFCFCSSAELFFNELSGRETTHSGALLVTLSRPTISQGEGDSFSIGLKVAPAANLSGATCSSPTQTFTIDSLCYPNQVSGGEMALYGDQLYSYLQAQSVSTSSVLCLQIYDASTGHSSNTVALTVDCTSGSTCNLSDSTAQTLSTLSPNGSCTWSSTGNTSSGLSVSPAMAFSPINHQPYVIYQDYANSFKATVATYGALPGGTACL